MAAHKSHPDSLSFFPAWHSWPCGFDLSDHFMTGHARESESRETAFNRKRIAVTNPTGLDTDSDLPKTGLDN
jgi:hypothetical protein